jgi:hypothetical protein
LDAPLIQAFIVLMVWMMISAMNLEGMIRVLTAGVFATHPLEKSKNCVLSCIRLAKFKLVFLGKVAVKLFCSRRKSPIGMARLVPIGKP